MKKLVSLTAFAGLIAVTALVALFILRSPAPGAPPPLPEPNGYNDFLRSGPTLLSNPSAPEDLDTDELRSLVAGNAGGLRLAREGMRKPCRVSLGYSTNSMSNHMAELATLKRLARAFLAEGKLAERENHPQNAATSYLDAIRFGHECSRGGVIIDMLVGVACQAMGCQAMENLVGQLEPTDCRQAIHQLEEMDAKAEPGTEVMQHELDWSRRTFGWRGRMAGLLMRKSLQENREKALAKLQHQQRATRLLLINLAVRAFEVEKGHRPDTVADLVPSYLKAPPKDPVTSAPMTLP